VCNSGTKRRVTMCGRSIASRCAATTRNRERCRYCARLLHAAFLHQRFLHATFLHATFLHAAFLHEPSYVRPCLLQCALPTHSALAQSVLSPTTGALREEGDGADVNVTRSRGSRAEEWSCTLRALRPAPGHRVESELRRPYSRATLATPGSRITARTRYRLEKAIGPRPCTTRSCLTCADTCT
jgi:hypothetical protein